MGYAGGKTPGPTYARIGDHTETLQVDFDPRVTSYETLLGVFWKSHDPSRKAWSTQYRHALFYHDEAQRKLAVETRAAIEKERGKKVTTEILPFTGFTLAEDYHQKHALRRYREIEAEFEAMYPEAEDLAHSAAAARVNAFAAGHGSCDDLREAAPGLGLSDRALAKLHRIVCGEAVSVGCGGPVSSDDAGESRESP